MIKIVERRLGVPDFYGVYIEPENGDGFIIYDQDRNSIERIAFEVRKRWRFIKGDYPESIKSYIREDVIIPPFFGEFLDDIDYERFTDAGDTYWLDNRKSIWILKTFD